MVICHMTSVHDSDDIRILKKECVSLAKKKENKVYLVAKGGSYNYENVEICGIGEVSRNRVRRVLSVSKDIYRKAISLDADIYHFHDPELLLYAKKLKKRGKKVIFDSHEYYYAQISDKEYFPKFMRKFIAGMYRMVENRACKYIDGAIIPCRIDGEHIFAKRVRNCAFIDNTPILEEAEIYAKNTVPLQDRSQAVCCIGSLTEKRGIAQLIDGCYKAGIKLILGGNFSPEAFKETIQAKREYDIVDYRGYCSREDVIGIYNESTIGASTLLNVGQYPKASNLPTKVYEYMMMGMPFITSNFDYSREVVENYNCGLLIEPDDSDSIAEALTFLLNNFKQAYDMGQNGKNAIQDRFNWEREEKSLYDLYDSVYEVD